MSRLTLRSKFLLAVGVVWLLLVVCHAFAGSPFNGSYVTTNALGTNAMILVDDGVKPRVVSYETLRQVLRQYMATNPPTGAVVRSNNAVLVLPVGSAETDPTNVSAAYAGQLIVSRSVPNYPFLNIASTTAKGDMANAIGVPVITTFGNINPPYMATNSGEYVFANNANPWSTTNKGLNTVGDNVLRLRNGAIDHYSAVAFDGINGTNAQGMATFGERGAVGYGNPGALYYAKMNYLESYSLESPFYFVALGSVVGGMAGTSGDLLWMDTTGTNELLRLERATRTLWLSNGVIDLRISGSAAYNKGSIWGNNWSLRSDLQDFGNTGNTGSARFSRFLSTKSASTPSDAAMVFSVQEGGYGLWQTNGQWGLNHGNTNYFTGSDAGTTNWNDFRSKGTLYQGRGSAPVWKVPLVQGGNVTLSGPPQTITFANAMPTTNYNVLLQSTDGSGHTWAVTSRTTTSFTFSFTNPGNIAAWTVIEETQ